MSVGSSSGCGSMSMRMPRTSSCSSACACGQWLSQLGVCHIERSCTATVRVSVRSPVSVETLIDSSLALRDAAAPARGLAVYPRTVTPAGT
eukprot:124272-Chlamydomonas_euryale.AAC.2